MKKKFAGAAAVFAMSIVLGAQCVQAGQWMRDDIGWWWQEDDGSYPKNWSRWLDGNQDGIYELYYFDENGYLYTDTFLCDGMVQVNKDGACVVDGQVLTQTYDPDEMTLRGPNLDLERISREVIRLVNEARRESGLDALTENPVLRENAAVRAQESAEDFGHLRPDGSASSTAVEVPYEWTSENLAQVGRVFLDEQGIAERIVNSWMNSPAHRDTILSNHAPDWTQTGVGICVKGLQVCAAQIFVK